MIDPTPALGTATLQLDRRQWLSATAGLAALFGLDSGGTLARFARSHTLLGFKPIPPSKSDDVRVPADYRARVFFPWGTPTRTGGPAWSPDASADDQRQQAGMHHDGMAYFPIDARFDPETGRLQGSSQHGYLAINHEYTDEGLLHADGVATWTAAKVRKSKAAVGVSVIEIRQLEGEWKVVDGWRITALDEVAIAGPARGHDLLKTGGDTDAAYERDGTGTEGTFANCANGITPWGTYLTCEENFQDHFARTLPTKDAIDQMDPVAKLDSHRLTRYGIGHPFVSVPGWHSTYGWERFDPHYDADRAEYRNHCHRYGWVVEIDPRDPSRKATKRTALGRLRHENAAVVIAPDGRVVVYMGDDARFEYVYKFVSSKRFDPELDNDDDATRRRKRDHNWTLLDDGKLYAARFDAGDTGEWIELSTEHPALAESGAFASTAEVVIFARHAADLVGATKMDRPEWIAVDCDPGTRRVRHAYVSLTNNSKRGAPGNEGPNPANPRADNIYGHILRWRDIDGDPTATTFQWSIFVACGNRQHGLAEQRGNIKDAPGAGSQDFGAPDSMTMDPRGGVLWVQTDVSVSVANETPFAALGNNQMLAIDVATGEVRRFLTGPAGCEITGLAFTPDCKTLFVNVQHPGEVGDGFSDPAHPLAVSRWPSGAADGRPRSATVVITHKDGKAIGA